MRAAVFDVDRTLLPGTTAERLFVRRLWREGDLGWRQALAGMLFSVRRPGPALVLEWRAQRPYLRGLEYGRVAALARRCFEEDIRPRREPAQHPGRVAPDRHRMLLEHEVVALGQGVRKLPYEVRLVGAVGDQPLDLEVVCDV